jgi:hypothetical protein
VRASLIALLGAFCLLATPGLARGARVQRMSGGRTTTYDDRFLSAAPVEPVGPGSTEAWTRRASADRDRTVAGELQRLRRHGQITPRAYRRYLTSFKAAVAEVDHLSPARAAELEAVVQTLHAIAASGRLTASRLPALFLTLDRNRQWWRSGPLLSYGQRVEFKGSQLVWEFYPGQGIELQQLGSFGKAQGMCAAGARYANRCRAIVAELVPLAARRAGGLTWEYYFSFDGGVPPWTSAMSQGTALQTFADAYRSLHDPSYLRIGAQALPVFSRRPPLGVAVPTRLGTRYLQYSFAPARSQDVINGFLQSLIGLDDYAQVSHDAGAGQLFAAGDAEAQAELPSFDTGAWSLYRPGEEDSLDYHKLVTGFLEQLCSMTHTQIYCTVARHFQGDLKTPPALTLLTAQVSARGQSVIQFSVSKISRVGITLIRNRQTVFLTSASFAYGRHGFAIPALKRRGTYTVKLDATDLAGNYSQITRSLAVR